MHEIFKKYPLFIGLDEKGIKKVEGIANLKAIKKGAVLFTQGDGAHGFYLVISGKIKIYRLSPQGQEYIMRIVGPGDTVAEAAVFSGNNYPASAEAIEDSSLYYLSKSDFLVLIQESPQLALNMMTGLSQLLRQLAQQVEDLSLKEVSARLARFLLEEAQKVSQGLAHDGLKIPLALKKSLLASRLGTIGETLSRTLAKLKQKEVIEIQKNVIILKNVQFLREIAEGLKI
jgi:CRP-like cAMP-binding protein